MTLLEMEKLKKNQDHTAEKIKINLIKNIIRQNINQKINYESTDLNQEIIEFDLDNQTYNVMQNLMYLMQRPSFFNLDIVDNYNFYRYLDLIKNHTDDKFFNEFLDLCLLNNIIKKNIESYIEYDYIFKKLLESF